MLGSRKLSQCSPLSLQVLDDACTMKTADCWDRNSWAVLNDHQPTSQLATNRLL